MVLLLLFCVDTINIMSDTERIGQLLERISRLVVSEHHVEGLKPVQWDALRYLGRSNRFSRNPRDLGEFLGTTKGSISQTLSTLEANGLLRKKPKPRDKRAVQLELTAAGRKIIRKDPMRRIAMTADTLSDADLATLADILERLLRQHLKARNGKPFGQCHQCRYLTKNANTLRCGLLNEPLSLEDTALICAEFVAP